MFYNQKGYKYVILNKSGDIPQFTYIRNQAFKKKMLHDFKTKQKNILIICSPNNWL